MLKLQKNPEMGRYYVAARPLKAGEVLFEEMPFVIGPKPDSPPICLGCYCPVDGGRNGPKCSKCCWPMCAECNEGGGGEWHRGECAVFVRSKHKFQCVDDSTTGCPQLDCITPLRLLLEKERHPQKWDTQISIMEDHEKFRRGTDFWNADQTNIVRYLREALGLRDRFSEELIQKAIGILEVNVFEARTSLGYNLRCLYAKVSMFAHSCCPNMTHSIWPSDNYKIIARPTVDLRETAVLYATYTYTLYGTSARQQHLRASKFFTCRCARCMDPTELGTHFSSFKCGKCEPGLITATDPLNDAVKWKCTTCDFVTTGASIQKAVALMQHEVDAVQNLEYGAERLEQYERLFRKFRNVLHPRHFIPTSIRHSLIEMYGRISGYEMQELSAGLLERKVELCREVLKVLDTFEAGKSRARATIMYELHAPLALLAKLADNPAVASDRLKESRALLIASGEILHWEDPTTPEGIQAQVAKQSLSRCQ